MTTPKDTDARAKLGARLRELRLAAGLTLEAAGDILDCNKSTVLRQEAGKSPVDEDDLRKLVHLYRISAGDYQDLRRLVQAGQGRKWWESYNSSLPATYMRFIKYEDQAESVRAVNAAVIPGMLQAPEYASTVIAGSPLLADPDSVETLLEVRLRRQQRLTDTENPLRYSAIIPETLLRYAIGGQGVLRSQLAHLRQVVKRPNVSLHVVPATHGIVVLPVELYDFGDGIPKVASSETAWENIIYDEPRAVRQAERMLSHYETSALSAENSIKLLDQIISEDV